jgi:hypothetical protein
MGGSPAAADPGCAPVPQVTYWAGGTKPLLIKSPVHTGRVKLLLQMFPRARFLYIHRHPMEARGWPSAGARFAY